MLKLYIGNKNYSSWSMRPWVLMTQKGIAFDEVMVPFGNEVDGVDEAFKRTIRAINPAGTVPVLVDGALVVWDTLAIAEYLAEQFPELHLWPREAAVRARARSVVAEMHAGFTALRSRCGMNIEAHLPEQGRMIWRDDPGVRANVARISAMWTELLAEHGGPMLLGDFSIADAYFAPVCMRLRTFDLPVSQVVQDYVARVAALPGVQAWIEGALAEQDFLAFEEPYRLGR